MTSKTLSISEFKAHCTEELMNVAKKGITLHLTEHGKDVATVTPVGVAKKPKTLQEWIGSGAGTATFAPDYDPCEPGAPAEDWEALQEDPVDPKMDQSTEKKAE